MEDQKKLLQFVTWLGENVPELKGQTPEQIVSTINKLSESSEGQEMLQGLIKEFESSTTGMFKKGGKLNYLICLKKGGSIKDCGCGKKIEKGQDGISRLDAINAAMDNGGFSKRQANFAYRNQKRALRNQGFKGAEMRQAARQNVFNSFPKQTPVVAAQPTPPLPVLDTNIEIEDVPIEINDTFIPIANQPLNVQKIDTFGGSFNSAFGAARRSGLDEFTWNGKRYTTKLGNSQPKSAPLGNAQLTVNKIMTGEGDPNATKRKDNPGVWYPGRPSR